MISWDYIEGPIAAFLLTGFGKRIWIFGDRHVLSYACATAKGLEGMRIGRLEHVIADLAPQMESDGQTLDVVVEVAPLRIERGTTNISHLIETYMESLSVFLGMCHVKGACTYPNVRFHAADARKNVHALDRLLSVAVRASSAMFHQMTDDYVPWTDISDDTIQEIASVLTPQDTEITEEFLALFVEKGCKTVRDVFDRLLDMAGINEAVAGIRDTPHGNAVVEYLDQKRHGARPDAVGFFTMHLDEIMKSERNTVYFLCQMMEEADWIMEVPLLATLLSSQVENAIVLAGFVHMERIAAQLQSLGFELEFEHVDLDSQCMQWPGTEPLF